MSEESWTAEAFTDFALRRQLRTHWLLAHWILHRARRQGIEPGGRDQLLDVGAGPALLSHMVACLTGARVHAAVQTDAFYGLARRPAVLPAPRAGEEVVLHLDPTLSLAELESPCLLAWSYACLHEFEERTVLLRRMAGAVAPGGLLLVLDTLKDARGAVEESLAGARLAPREVQAIRDTFASSLGLEQARDLFRTALPEATVEVLEFDDETLFESEISQPAPLEDEGALEIQIPTLFAAQWRAR